VIELAHITLAELPGSVVIWIGGVGLGVLLGAHRGRSTLAAIRGAFRRSG
jgi:hypothetical protein